MSNKHLSDIGEFQLLNKFKKLAKDNGPDILVSIGDDTAAFTFDKKNPCILISTDSLLENIHFTLSSASPQQVGYKAVCVNISDIAAMGGIPKYILTSISVGKNTPAKVLNDLYKGIIKCTKKYNLKIIGGNTTASYAGLIITITIIGATGKKQIITRKGAQAGDLIVITGSIGEAYAGLNLLKNKASLAHRHKKCIYRHLLPEPRLHEGRLLALHKLATAMIDISDGLASDLRHILEEANVGANLYLDQLPISYETKK